MAGKDQPRKSVASYLNLGTNPIAQLNSFVTKAKEIPEEEVQLLSLGECTSINSITSEDDFIIIDEDDVDIDLSVAHSRQGKNDPSSASTGNVAASSQTEGSKSTKHPLPLTPIQQRILQDKLSVRRTVLEKLEQNGYKATLDFDHGEIDIETQGSEGTDNALSILKKAILEVKLDFKEEELQKMASATDITDGEPVLPLSMSSSDQEILVVIDRTEGSMKMIGLADNIEEVKEKLRKSQDLLNPCQGSSVPAPKLLSLQYDPSSQDSSTNRSNQEEAVSTLVTVRESPQEYLMAHKDDEIFALATDANGLFIDMVDEGFNVRGPPDAVKAAVDVIKVIVGQVRTDAFTFDVGVNMASFTEASIKAGKEHNVMIAYKQSNMTARAGIRAKRQAITQGDPPERSATLRARQEATVIVNLKRLETQEVDVVVNTTNTKLNLSEGLGVSNSILKAAGEEIQQELRNVKKHGIEPGTMAMSGPGKMTACKKIYHVALPYYRGGGRETMELSKCYEHLVSAVFHCLTKAATEGYKTIAFPAFGTGALEYPIKKVVQLMFKAIERFNQQAGSIEKIFIVISPDTRSEVKQHLVSAVFHCLTKAATEGYKTIAFPAFGTGALEYPVKNVVQLMFKAIERFNQQAGSIEKIFIVISPDTRSEVKQLFLAHQLTHYLKTRYLKCPEQREGLFKKLRSQTSSTTTDFFQSEVAKTDEPKCEVRAKTGDTLLQVIHGDIRKACEVIDTVMVPWIGDEISTPNDQPSLRCTDPDKQQWSCRTYVTELPRTKCIADSTTIDGKTLIHTYSKEATERCLSEALQKGLEKAAKQNCSLITIPIPTGSTMAARPSDSVSAVISAIDGSRSGVNVVTVVIPNDNFFIDFVNKLAGMRRLEEPADISMTKFVDTLWSVTHANQAVRSQNRAAAFNTGVDAKMVVTSDCPQKNRAAAQEVANYLKVQLCDVHSSRNVARPT